VAIFLLIFVYVSKLTHDLNYSVTFPTHYVYHDLAMGRMIVTIKEQEGCIALRTWELRIVSIYKQVSLVFNLELLLILSNLASPL